LIRGSLLYDVAVPGEPMALSAGESLFDFSADQLSSNVVFGPFDISALTIAQATDRRRATLVIEW
jgi:hypothetical protein